MKTRTHATACAWAFAVGLVAAANAEAPPDRDGDNVSDVSDSCPDDYGSGSDGCPNEDDVETVIVTGERTINLRTRRGYTIDCTSPVSAWSTLCSGFYVSRVGASPSYTGIWNSNWSASNDRISCPAGSRPRQGQNQSWRCACAPGFRNANGRAGLPCITNAEFLDNAGPPPVCLCGQPTIPYDHTTWVCPPESVCDIMWYVVPHACRAAVAAISGVACNNVAGRIICSVIADRVQDMLDVCPEVGPPVSPEEALGGLEEGGQNR